jgi:hypothetical protein
MSGSKTGSNRTKERSNESRDGSIKKSGSKLEALNAEPEARIRTVDAIFDALDAELTANTKAQMGDGTKMETIANVSTGLEQHNRGTAGSSSQTISQSNTRVKVTTQL